MAPGRRLALAVIGALAFLLGWAGLAPFAHAAGDTYDRWDVAYVVTPDGVVQVTETITLRFGPQSGRHGLERLLVVREPYDEAEDMLYEVTNVRVTSPDAVSTMLDLSTYSDSDRVQVQRIRVGDPNRTISAPTATYVLSYDVRGALRSPNGQPELYWDVTGSTLGAIATSTVRVDVPGGAREVVCFAGPPRTSLPCDAAAISDGAAVMRADGLAAGDVLTVGVRIDPTMVTNAEPIRTERADAAAQRTTLAMQAAGGAALVGVPLLGWAYYRRRGRDERFAGLPPGTVPPAGATAAVVPHDADIEIPVAFAPPKLPLAYAGFLLDGQTNTGHLTATLVDLAVSGAIQLDSEGRPSALLRDPARAHDQPGRIVLRGLFGEGRSRVDFGHAGDLAGAYDAVALDARQTAGHNGWFRQLHRGRKSGSILGSLWLVAIGALWFDFSVLAPLVWFLVPATLALVVTWFVVRAKMSRGQRTATGRAWTDQVEGFRTYIATAEADQLRFEEGEDIFSRYLPWAILFGLADRWVRVCEQAIALGRLAAPDASWYGSTMWDPRIVLWNLNAWNHSVGPAVGPAMAAPSFGGDTGFGGGGSAFGGGGFAGGGGFSGGGGGGGGGGSW